MGFTVQQPRYAEAGLITFPVNFAPLPSGKVDKVPAVKGWQKIGAKGSAALGQKESFAACGVGLVTGKRSGLTILDIDTPSENALADALSKHGKSPVIAKTASGKFHVWYKHNGEGRHIRPFEGLDIDILGQGGAGGFAVVPDSEHDGKRYEFIQGGLDAVPALPVMRGLEGIPALERASKAIEKPLQAPALSSGKFPVGQRTKALFDALRDYAGRNQVTSESGLLEFGRLWLMAHCEGDYPEVRLLGQVKGVLKLIEQGRCWTKGQGQKVVIDGDELERLASSPDALCLYMMLQKAHWDRERFALANAFGASLGWSKPRFQKARDTLQEFGLIACLQKGGNGPNDPPIFTLNIQSHGNIEKDLSQ